MGCCCSVSRKTSFFRRADGPVPACESIKRKQLLQQQEDNNDDSKENNNNNNDNNNPSTTATTDTTAMPQSLEELREFGDSLQTGDVILMHCTHTFGKITQVATNSVWDHVAMVVRLDDEEDTKIRDKNIQVRLALIQDKPLPKSRTVGDWPSPGESGPVELLEAMAGGAFCYPFYEHTLARGKFAKYAAVRRLRNRQGHPLDKQAKKKIQEFCVEFWGRPFENAASFMEVIRPVLSRPPKPHLKRNKSRENLDRVFCSELVIAAYQYAGLLPNDTLNSNDILPAMFAPKKAVDQYLQREAHGFILGQVEIFKGPGTPLYDAILNHRNALRVSHRKDPISRTVSDDNFDLHFNLSGNQVAPITTDEKPIKKNAKKK